MDDDKAIDGTTCLEALKLICDKYFPDKCSFEQYEDGKICFEKTGDSEYAVYVGNKKEKTEIRVCEAYYEVCCDILKRLSISKRDYLDLRMLLCCEIGILVKARRKEGSREPVYRVIKRR